MKPRCRERQYHLSPGIGQLREAVQQQDQGPSLGLKAGLQYVYPQSVDIRREARTNAWRKRSTLQWRQIGHARLLLMDRQPSLAENAEKERVRRAVSINQRRRSSAAP